MKKIIVILFILNVSVLGNSFLGTGGSVPFDKNARPPSTDLIYEGSPLSSFQALELRKNGYDLSTLSPSESDIWSNHVQESNTLDEINFSSNTQLQYFSNLTSRLGNFRFTARSEDNKEYILMLSKKVHNNLLRQSLLKKLGYNISPVKYLKKVTINFSNIFEKEIFITDLKQNTLGSPERWVVNDKEELSITVQDLIIMDANITKYNVALGYIPKAIIQSRRVLNSLLIPYSLTNVPESINQLPWDMAKSINQSFKFEYPEANEFSTSIEDAIWIARKIAKLTKIDFQEIVSASMIPYEAQILLIEKLISRRNFLVSKMGLKVKELKVNENISYGDNLKDGKLLKHEWSNYGSRFSFPDPDSPLSNSELFAFFKSEGISNALSFVVSKFNTTILPQVNIEKELIKHQEKVIQSNIANYLRTGKVRKTPLGLFAFPIFDSNLIASRDIVAGSYLGTDNKVSLADTIGVNVKGGVFIGTDGIPIPWSASGEATGSITRTYTHVKPVTSIKLALKTPFKNILVNLTTKRITKAFDNLKKYSQNQDDEELKTELVRISEMFKNSLKIGESLIISDSIGANLEAKVGRTLSEIFQLQSTFFGNQILISRIHISRSSENSIQIYRSKGNIGSIGISFDLNAKIPIITLKTQLKKGKANTQYTKVDINEESQLPHFLAQTYLGLSELIKNKNMELLKDVYRPYKIKQTLHAKETDFDFLFFKNKFRSSQSVFRFDHPKGDTRFVYKRETGRRSGLDFQSFGTEIVNALVQEYSDYDIIIPPSQSDNPADTLYGRSYAKNIRFETELKDKTGKGSWIMREPFHQVTHLWKGWKLSKSRLKRIIDSINEKYKQKLYSSKELKSTKSIELYQIQVNLYVYRDAITFFSKLKKDTVKNIFMKNYEKRGPIAGATGKGFNKEKLDRAISKIYKLKSQLAKLQYVNNYSEFSKSSTKLISIIESSLSIEGIKKIFGNYIYLASRIEGFRVGSESGDRPIISNSFGAVGSREFAGPLFKFRQSIGMSESEFFHYWLLRKL